MNCLNVGNCELKKSPQKALNLPKVKNAYLIASQVAARQLSEDVPVEERAQDEALRARRPLEVRSLWYN